MIVTGFGGFWQVASRPNAQEDELNANLKKMRHIHMQGLYTGCAEDVQAPDERTFGTANILDDALLDARIIPSPDYERRSTSAWQAKLNAAPDPKIAYHAIIEEWRTGCYDADIAIGWLQAYRLLTAPYTGDPYELMCRAAYDEFGPVALPEPVSAPIPSVSNSKPFQPDGGAS